jgi:hypothetical protein
MLLQFDVLNFGWHQPGENTNPVAGVNGFCGLGRRNIYWLRGFDPKETG